MNHYKLTFLDRDDVHIDAEEMRDAIEQVPNHSLIGCEEIDVTTGQTLGGIYQRPRNFEEIQHLLYQVVREIRTLPAESPNREFLRGKLAGLSMAYFDDWQYLQHDDHGTIELPEDK
jgi:hypothetical protein